MLSTRLSQFFNIDHPILSAPMASASGGRLAASVTKAGGLGFIGGAYGDADWIEEQFTAAENSRVGCGFITWHLDKALADVPDLLDRVLAKHPQALFLSFGDPKPHIRKIEAAGVPLICQVQNIHDAKIAIDRGANVLVAQGGEAGGHGQTRGTMAFVPETADLLAQRAPQVLLCAAGGIADGRGLAAALMLGADGVLIGSRLWASEEALVHPNMWEAAKRANGDDTIRSSVMDIARHLNWPKGYTARVLQNSFTERWHGNIEGLLEDATTQAALWKEAWLDGNVDIANTFVGEATGLINQILPAAEIIETMVREAQEQLSLYG